MATYRLKLSDGTNGIDLYGGSDTIVMEGGLNMPPPRVKSQYVSNPFFDGARLTSASYENRVITLTVKIVGSSLSNLKTNIRSIQRLLNDAEKRMLLGYGAQVYLEYQWGDTEDQSTFFDVLRGDLAMPKDYLSALLTKFYVLNATLTLICKPFGRYKEQDIEEATLENSQSTYTIKESHLIDDDSSHVVHGDTWECQQFKTTSAFTAVGAAIQLFIDGDVTGITLTLALYETDTSLPTGSAIATASGLTITHLPNMDDAGVGDAMPTGWIRGIFASSVALSDATEYALVANLSAGDGNNAIRWKSDSGAGKANAQRGYSINGGSSWDADDTDDNLFAIYAAETDENFQDITTDEADGDVPAKLYIKIAQSNAANSEKIWIAKRSGTRYDDDLWIEGEDYSSFYKIIGAGAGANTLTPQSEPDIDASGEIYCRVRCYESGTLTAANTAMSRLNYTISTLPKGQFRVLIRCRVVAEDTDDSEHMSFGFGWSYGDKTYAPTEAKGEYYQCADDSIWEILDLGILNIPPIAESDIASNNTFELRIFQYATEAFTAAERYNWDIDYIFLLPIDEGVVIIDGIAAADLLAIDNITDPSNVFIIDDSDKIEEYPTHVGAPFSLGREDTRIYILREDDKNVTFTVDTKYQPQFLVI